MSARAPGRDEGPSLAAILADFEAAQAWLQSFITDPTGSRFFVDKPPPQRLREYRAQLARMADFLAFAGDPQAAFKSVHVAGTSGKGSVTTLTAALLTACGERTGHHVSPYLQVCNEKLIVDGRLIRPSAFTRLVDDFRRLHDAWRAARGATDGLRYGEAWVALTFLWLAGQQLNWGVVETGMGGRYDPTNVMPSDLAVITNVGRDHVKALGPDLTDIANHKAGIIKPGGRVVTAATEPAVRAVIAAEAARQGADLYRLGHDFAYTVEGRDEGFELIVDSIWGRFDGIRLPLPGDFLAVNAATVVAAVAVLARDFGVALTPERARAALSGATVPGRVEIVQERPLTILDGAHNAPKMAALAESLAVLKGKRRVTAVIGTLVNKEADALVACLAPLVDHFIVTRPRVFGKPGRPAAELADVVRRLAPAARVTAVDDVADAVARGLATAGDENLLVVTGSLYLVGEARDHWYPREELLAALELQ